MPRVFLFVTLVLTAVGCVWAQNLEEMNVQVHGYAAQGFMYSNQNNWNATDSTSGSPAWTEAVVNLNAQPISSLRVGAQVRYYVLGQYGKQITLDWASGDYRFNDRLGVRFGKVKSPSGLFNETQDIDPSFVWSLLPSSTYAIASRTTVLAHNGVVAYGTVTPGKRLGKLDYKAWGATRHAFRRWFVRTVY